MAEFPKNPTHQTQRVVSLHGGANQRSVGYLLDDTECLHIENAIINVLGKRTRRDGARAFGGIVGDPPGGLSSMLNGEGDERILAIWGSKLYLSGGGADYDQKASDVTFISGLLHQMVAARGEAENQLVICTCEKPTETGIGIEGRDNLVVYSLASNVATTASLAPRCVASFQNRIFFAEGETVGWSAVGQLASYSDLSTVLVEPGLGGEITAIVPARDSERPLLWVFKESAIIGFEVRWGADGAFIPDSADQIDTINSRIRPLTLGTGCIATKSAVWVPGAQQPGGEGNADIYFLSREGVRTLARAANDVQSGASPPLTYKIPTWVDRINWSAAHRAVASVYDNAYHLAVPLDGSLDNNYILRYDLATQAWSLHSLEMRDLANIHLGQAERLWGQNVFATADTSTTDAIDESSESQPYQLYRIFETAYHDPSTDPTNVVIPRYREESKMFVLGDPMTKKSWDWFKVQYSSEDTSVAEIAYKVDGGEFVTITETKLPGGADTIVLGEDALPWSGTGDRIRLRSFGLSDVQAGYSIEIRVQTPTGATETGRPSFYMQEVEGRPLTRAFDNE